MATVPKEGRINLLKFIANQMVAVTKVRLATDMGSDAEADIDLADITEATFDGYAAQDYPNESAPTINGSGQAQHDGGRLTFTAGSGISAPQTIVGIYLTCEPSSGFPFLLWVHKYSSGRVVTDPGDKVEAFLNWFADNLVP